MHLYLKVWLPCQDESASKDKAAAQDEATSQDETAVDCISIKCCFREYLE